jgi:hypothetical protein
MTIYVTQAIINETTCEIKSYTELSEGEYGKGFAKDENGNEFLICGDISEILSIELIN